MHTLGIHFDERSVRAVVLERERQQTTLLARSEVPVESPADHADGLRAVLDELADHVAGKGLAVGVAIPAGWGFWARFTIPSLRPGTARFATAVLYELERFVPIGIEELVACHVANDHDVLVGAIPHERLAKLDAVLQEAGVYPDVVSPDGLAARQALSLVRPEETPGPLCVRADNHWVFIASGPSGPAALRALRTGPESPDESDSAAGDAADSPTVVAGHLRAFLAAAGAGDGVVVVGPCRDAHPLVEHLTAGRHADAREITELSGCAPEPWPAEFLPAVGAGVAAGEGGAPITFPLESVGHPMQRKRLWRSMAGACMAAALLLAALAWQYGRVAQYQQARYQRAADEIRRLWTAEYGSKRPVPLAVRATLAAELRSLTALAGAGGVPQYREALQELHELIERLPPDLPVNLRSIRVNQQGATIRGHARSHTEAGRIAAALDSSPRLTCATPVTRANQDGTVNFTMRISYAQ